MGGNAILWLHWPIITAQILAPDDIRSAKWLVHKRNILAFILYSAWERSCVVQLFYANGIDLQ